MPMYFSKETNGFYSSHIHGDNIPHDAKEIDDETYCTLLQGMSDGYVISSDESGYPVMMRPEPPSREELVVQEEARKAQLQREAEDAIKPLERAKQLDMATADELKWLEAWERYSVLLMRVDTSTAPDIKWPTLPTV